MDKKDRIKELINVIKHTPPEEEGDEYWNKHSWEDALRSVPGLFKLLEEEQTWREIEYFFPTSKFENFLYYFLQYAPLNLIKEYLLTKKGALRHYAAYVLEKEILPYASEETLKKYLFIDIENVKNTAAKYLFKNGSDETLKEYLLSDDETIKSIGVKTLLENDGQRLTCNIWNLFNKETKLWIIAKVMDYALDDFKSSLNRLGNNFGYNFSHYLGYEFRKLFERRYHDAYTIEFKPEINIPPELNETFNNFDNFLKNYPLWFKLKNTVELCDDSFSYNKIREIEPEKVHKPSPNKFPRVSKNVMFDPSLLMSPNELEKIIAFMGENSNNFKFYISCSFYELIKSKEIGPKILEFFEYEGTFDPHRLIQLIENPEEGNNLRIFSIPRLQMDYAPDKEKYGSFYVNLSEEVENKVLRDIIFEEWVFLQEKSWLISKSEKIFDKFKESGSHSLELNKKVFRAQMQKDKEEVLEIVDKLLELDHYIGFGCITLALLTNISFGIYCALLNQIFGIIKSKRKKHD